MAVMDLDVRERVPLERYTTLELGGPARYFVECTSDTDVRAALIHARERQLPVAILGGGSNVVFPDSGFPGLVIRMCIGGIQFRDAALLEVTAGAGLRWDDLVRQAVERGWAGVECLSGIPGTVGAAPIQNVGAYGQEIAETLFSVDCLDRTTLEQRRFTASECRFGYRTSRFKQQDRGRWVVLEATFRLRRDATPQLRYPELQEAVARAAVLGARAPVTALQIVRDTVLALRRRKSMVLDPHDPDTRSTGSFFLNPVLTRHEFDQLRTRWTASGRTDAIPAYPLDDEVKVPAAWLVEHAGFSKGYRRGGVGISSHHALALVNYGGTVTELLALSDAIATAVAEQFGIRLEPEPEIVR